MNFLREYLAGRLTTQEALDLVEEQGVVESVREVVYDEAMDSQTTLVCDGTNRDVRKCSTIPVNERCDHCLIRAR